jgi:hypothetical protein
MLIKPNDLLAPPGATGENRYEAKDSAGAHGGYIQSCSPFLFERWSFEGGVRGRRELEGVILWGELFSLQRNNSQDSMIIHYIPCIPFRLII